MKTILLFSLALAVVCNVVTVTPTYAQFDIFGGKSGSGKILSDTREVSGFSKIRIAGSADVIFKHGAKREVIIEADDNIWEDVLTDVNDGELTLSMKRGSYRNIHLKFIITNPTLEGVQVSGSGSIIVETPLNAKELVSGVSGSGFIRYNVGKADKHEVAISGSGNVDAIKVQANDVDVRISGSGDAKVYAAKSLRTQVNGSGSVDVDGITDAKQIISRTSGSGTIRFKGNGKAERHEITIGGSGNVIADNIQTDNVSVQIFGSGDATVYANKSLDAQLNASGSVYYRGDATNITKSVRGSGRVNKR